MRDRYDPYDRGSERSGLERALERAVTYLQTRTADHWLMLLAGIVIGLIVS